MSLPRAFRTQATACAGLGSPLMARLMGLMADRLHPGTPLTDRMFGWPGDVSIAADNVPLRLAGGLHALVLTGADPALAAAYADPPDDSVLWAAVAGAMARHERELLVWLDSAPQTNEVRRSSVLIAAGHWLAARTGLPMQLSELGSSAGLNLAWPDYGLRIGGKDLGAPAPVLLLSPDWRGDPPPPTRPVIDTRAGVDLNPLNPVADRLRLLAYLWPDQPERRRLTLAALNHVAAHGPALARGDAVDWLESRLAQDWTGRLHLVFHTVAWQYFPAPTRRKGEALFAAAGARATASAPLARLAMEPDGATPGAAVTLTLWPGGRVLPLGRADFHGRWVDWQAPPP